MPVDRFVGRSDYFSADSLEISSDGELINSGKLYVSEDAIRIDGIPAMGMLSGLKLDLSVLIFKNQNKQYFYNNDKKRVLISQMDKKHFNGDYKSMGNIRQGQIMGSEYVAGYLCDKKEIIISYDLAGHTFDTEMTVWENDQFDFPLKIMDEDGNIQVLRNINTDQPSVALFQPLSGYQTVDSTLAVMGMNFSDLAGSIDLTAMKEKVQNFDMSQMMERMNQVVDNNLSAEQKNKMMELMDKAMSQFKGVDIETGE